MKRSSLVMLIVVPVTSAAFATACGSGSSSQDKTSTAAASVPAAAATKGGSPAAGGAESNSVTVTAMDFSFTPATLTASKRETLNLTLKNNGAAPHTLTIYTDQDYKTKVSGGDTGQVASGASGNITLTIPSDSGDLYFRCEVHPTLMMGEISVD